MCTDQQVQQDIITIIQNNRGSADPVVVVDTISEKYGRKRLHHKQISVSRNIADLVDQQVIERDGKYIKFTFRRLAYLADTHQ